MKNDAFVFEIIEKVFGEDSSVKRQSNLNLPFIYLNSFNLYEVKGTFSFVFVVPKQDDVPYDLIKGMYVKCQNIYGSRVIMYVDDSSKNNKQFYIDSHINFVSSDYDYRLFNDDELVDVLAYQDKVYKNSYTKITQLIVNFYLNNEPKDYSVREIAKQFGFSFSSVSRANAFLHEIGAINKVGVGNSAKYRIISKKVLLDKAKPFFINPIKNRRLVLLDENITKSINGYYSGENAFAKYTDLEIDDKFIEVALEKEKYKELESLKNKQNKEYVCYLEEFIYDPSYFAIEDTISLFDTYIIAYMRYRGNSDPRINSSLKSLEKRIIK